jgi:MoaD family protein
VARVRLFASLREAAETSDDDFDAGTVGELLEQARARYGKAFSEAMPFARIAVNGVDTAHLQGEATPIEPGDEVALLPPVSGGEGAGA